MMTPYTTKSGLQIGLLYARPMPTIQGDALRLQAALLERRIAMQPTLLQRLTGAVWRWL